MELDANGVRVSLDDLVALHATHQAGATNSNNTLRRFKKAHVSSTTTRQWTSALGTNALFYVLLAIKCGSELRDSTQCCRKST
eukprot:12706-Heterococcus_DN1.PRE.2